ncbi:hypothetical protein CLOM_g20937, partial [Closterium sp. NIES-68]
MTAMRRSAKNRLPTLLLLAVIGALWDQLGHAAITVEQPRVRHEQHACRGEQCGGEGAAERGSGRRIAEEVEEEVVTGWYGGAGAAAAGAAGAGAAVSRYHEESRHVVSAMGMAATQAVTPAPKLRKCQKLLRDGSFSLNR